MRTQRSLIVACLLAVIAAGAGSASAHQNAATDLGNCGKTKLVGQTWKVTADQITCARGLTIGRALVARNRGEFTVVRNGGASKEVSLPSSVSRNDERWQCTLFYGDRGTKRKTTNFWWCMDLAHPTSKAGVFPGVSFTLIPKVTPSNTTGSTTTVTKGK